MQSLAWLPPTLARLTLTLEAQVRNLFSNFTIVGQSSIGVSVYGGPTRTTEFTGLWLYNQTNRHGTFTVNIGTQTNPIIDRHLSMATPDIWPAVKQTMQLIQDHITYCPAGGCV